MLTQVQVAIHLLEAMGQLLLTGAGDRASCAPEDELKALQLVDLLREKLEPHAHERFQLLDGLISTLLGADGADEEPQQPDERPRSSPPPLTLRPYSHSHSHLHLHFLVPLPEASLPWPLRPSSHTNTSSCTQRPA